MAVIIPAKLCSPVNETIPVIEESVNENTVFPTPISFINLSFVSLVRLFNGSLVTTWPKGDLTAKDCDAGGFSDTLSLSSWG